MTADLRGGSPNVTPAGMVSTRSETARGASTTDTMLAGAWKTARMVAHATAPRPPPSRAPSQLKFIRVDRRSSAYPDYSKHAAYFRWHDIVRQHRDDIVPYPFKPLDEDLPIFGRREFTECSLHHITLSCSFYDVADRRVLIRIAPDRNQTGAVTRLTSSMGTENVVGSETT